MLYHGSASTVRASGITRLGVAVRAKDAAIGCALRLDAQHHKSAESVILRKL